MNVLIVEDDEKILKYVAKGLKEEGFTVDTSSDGYDGLYLAQVNEYDIIILDWMLPNISGLKICKKLREEKNITPILMLTARSDIEDKIESLDSGVDDYLTKPFVFGELISRIKSLIRRCNYNSQDIINVDTLELNITKRTVKRAGKAISLTTKEFSILHYLVENIGNIVTHTRIEDKIWGINEVSSSNVINVFVHHLRKKIDTKGELPLIKTVRGSGYKIEKLS
ncbi:MAG: DNA-binding response OmpR family regulator [Sulfurimonas sp.]|jgi:DNA-binding response OmpR family regulator